MRGLVSFLFVIIIQVSLYAEKINRLVVSDIDDTLKISHVLSSTGKFVRALDTEAVFTGMPTVLQLLTVQPEYNTKVVYLSNAPQKIAGAPVMQYVHQSFLANNNFPVGPVVLNLNPQNKNHKLDYLRKILSSEPVQELVLIGDNGERDTEIYEQIQNEFSSRIKIFTFIHQIYSSDPLDFVSWLLRFDRSDESGRGKSLLAGQVGFVTAMEIALELKNQNRLHAESWDWMLQKILPRILHPEFSVAGMGTSQAFPSYMKCSDFVWKWPNTEELKPLQDLIKRQCR